MNVCELRTSILEGLGVTITEVPHEEIGEEPTSKVVITAPRALLPELMLATGAVLALLAGMFLGAG